MSLDSETWNDANFLAAFLDGTLPASEFGHRGHLRAAWLVLSRHPVQPAVVLICRGIAAIATRLGAPEKFHYTLTEAMVRIVAARMRQTPNLDWPAFVVDHADLLHDARQILQHHYSDALLQSAAARTGFVAPDRAALPD